MHEKVGMHHVPQIVFDQRVREMRQKEQVTTFQVVQKMDEMFQMQHVDNVFFFATHETETRSLIKSAKKRASHSGTPCLTDDLVDGRDSTIHTTRDQAKERHGKSLTFTLEFFGEITRLAQANSDKNSTVSVDNRPPTSAPRMTNRALLPSPANSGHVRSLRWWACSRAFPFVSPAPRIALRSRRRGDTNVVSMAN